MKSNTTSKDLGTEIQRDCCLMGVLVRWMSMAEEMLRDGRGYVCGPGFVSKKLQFRSYYDTKSKQEIHQTSRLRFVLV